eukprot:CAMPEP_0168347694 /NCGR_PEP_ID=MMETSP0213-20121227/19188_1 /TAXON_ID=151035 /ORGANISM="Euplotes harpa, Strain FSP1.4" /LENGTH=122 /DNA_ID=CAMNT_0008356923 /DNA_START=21 /DNA_END=385 /DNA_ORIENTATION=+
MTLQNLGLLLLLSSILLSGTLKLLSLLSPSPTSFPENADFLRKSLSPGLPCHLLILCMGLAELLLPLTILAWPRWRKAGCVLLAGYVAVSAAGVYSGQGMKADVSGRRYRMRMQALAMAVAA